MKTCMKYVFVGVVSLIIGGILSLSAGQNNYDGRGFEMELRELLRPIPPAERQKRMGVAIRWIGKSMPCSRLDDAYTTLGVLSRYSENIVVGKITDAWTEDEGGKRVDRNRGGWFQKIEFSAKTNILGQVSSPSIKLNYKWQGLGDGSLKSGENAIVFLSGKQAVNLMMEVAYEEGTLFSRPAEPALAEKNPPKGGSAIWAWIRGLPSSAKKAPPKDLYLLGQERGVITFDGEDELDEYLTVLSGYLRYLPDRKENPEAYYMFLRSLLKSSNPRIKEDARSDLLYLVRLCPEFDVNLVLNDEAVDDWIKNYLRLVWIPLQTGTPFPWDQEE